MKLFFKDEGVSLYTLFISFRFGDHYCGVHSSLELLHDAVGQLARDMKIRTKEIPSLEEIEDTLAARDSFYHEFSDTTWITIQKTSTELVDRIREAFKKEVMVDMAVKSEE